MTAIPHRSLAPLTCDRCTSIGLPPGGIAVKETYMEVSHLGESGVYCLDCWNRMAERVEESSDE